MEHDDAETDGGAPTDTSGNDLGQRAVAILQPYVGLTLAETMLSAKALALGKTIDSLSPDDLPYLEESVRRLLGPVASRASVDMLAKELRGLE